jgi:hypothetical protein
LHDRGWTEQDASKHLRTASLTFGVRFIRDSLAHWCFVIEENVRQYSTVIAIGVTTDEIDPMDRVFCIPTADFGAYNVKAFSEADECYSNYQVHEEKIREALLSVFPDKEMLS